MEHEKTITDAMKTHSWPNGFNAGYVWPWAEI